MRRPTTLKILAALTLVLLLGLLGLDTNHTSSLPGAARVSAAAALPVFASGNTTSTNLAETITYPDTDGDGCNDVEELGPDRRYGGERDPAKRDFYDLNHDGWVSSLDIESVAFRIGVRKGDPSYGDGRFDLAKVGDGNNPKDLANLGPPDGQITMDDFYAAQAQPGDTCRGPLTFSLADISADCGGNFREAGGVVKTTVPESGKVLKDCLLVRDATGKLVNVVYEETTAKLGGTGASICVSCLPGEDYSLWYETSAFVKREQLWPPDWLRCTPGLGFLPQWCAPQVVTEGLDLDCSWKYVVSSSVYNGAVVPESCWNWVSTNYPSRLNTLYDIQTSWVTFGFQQDVTDRALFELAPYGVVWQQLMFEVGIRLGPWDRSETWWN